MKNNRTLIITLIIILSILAISVIGFLILLLTNKFSFYNFVNFNQYSDTIIHDEYYDNKFELIDIKNSLGDINIISSEDDQIHVVVYGEEELFSINEDSALSITYKAKSCIGFCFNQPSSKIDLYVPSDYDKKIKIESKAGDIKVSDFELANFDIESDLGDTNIGIVDSLNIIVHAGDMDVDTVKTIEAENDLGDITITKIKEYFDIRNNCGDIEINDVNITKNSKIYNALGDITVKHTNDINIEASVKLGDMDINKNNSKSDIQLEIENRCGDIEVN